MSYILVTDQCGFREGISNENSAFRLADWFRFCLTAGGQKSRRKKSLNTTEHLSLTGAQRNMEIPRDEF
jgi:hypothetical protein